MNIIVQNLNIISLIFIILFVLLIPDIHRIEKDYLHYQDMIKNNSHKESLLEHQTYEGEDNIDGVYKICPHCRRHIPDNATKCPLCDQVLE